jgi:hypothetical protein
MEIGRRLVVLRGLDGGGSVRDSCEDGMEVGGVRNLKGVGGAGGGAAGRAAWEDLDFEIAATVPKGFQIRNRNLGMVGRLGLAFSSWRLPHCRLAARGGVGWGGSARVRGCHSDFARRAPTGERGGSASFS